MSDRLPPHRMKAEVPKGTECASCGLDLTGYDRELGETGEAIGHGRTPRGPVHHHCLLRERRAAERAAGLA